MADYVLSEADREQKARLDSIAAGADVGTIRLLSDLGVDSGWRCAEVGAGSGTVAEWLCERVGSTGSVTATDLNTRWLELLKRPNLEVRHHDIGTDPLLDRFDVVHVRNVLCHVRERDRAFSHLVDAVRPGGWLLVEDVDFLGAGVCFPPNDKFERFTGVIATLMERSGGDPYIGRKLFVYVVDAGLRSTGWDVRNVPTTDDSLDANLGALGPVAVDAGLMSQTDVNELKRDPFPAFRYGPRFVAAWGMKPDDDTAQSRRGSPATT